MLIFRFAHWLLPWLILVIGIYSIIRFARGYFNESTFMAKDHRPMSVFSGLMDLQGLFGPVFFFGTAFPE